MEPWAALIGEPMIKTGKTRVFGLSNNPINFVSAHDVARFVELAVVNSAIRSELVEVGRLENLSMRQVAQTFETVTGKAAKKSHVPLPMMRLISVLMHPVKPTLARQIQAGVVMDTHGMYFDPSKTVSRYPSISPTSLAEIVRRDYVG